MLRTLLLVPVYIYRAAISPFLPSRCRFLPSCSEYAVQALSRHGALAGSWLVIRRLARCHPFGGSGIDEVPSDRPVFRCACIGLNGFKRVLHPEHSERPPCRPSA